MRRRRHIITNGGAISIPIGGFRTFGNNNLRQWGTMENGASRVTEYQGEDDVVLLGYTYPGSTTAQIKMAQFTLSDDIGPTASAASCSPIRMISKPAQAPLTDGYFWNDNGVWQSAIVTANDFDDGAGAYPAGTFKVGDSQPKPSTVQMVIGVWFEHDGVYQPVHPTYRGVFNIGIGGGDIIYLENLTTGAGTWLFTGFNEFRSDGLDLPQSTDWSGGTDYGFDNGTLHHVVWMDSNASRTDTWRISIRNPGWANGSYSAPFFLYPPQPMRYYVQVYMVEGCSIISDVAVDGSMVGTIGDPDIDDAGKAVTPASVGHVII